MRGSGNAAHATDLPPAPNSAQNRHMSNAGGIAALRWQDRSNATEGVRNAESGHWPPRQWWAVQCSFWFCLSAITFLTLTVWYATVEWPHVLHTLLQGVLGLLFSWPLYRVLQAIGELRTVARVLAGCAAVAGVALVWTLLRMVTFAWMTGISGLWADFGGWYFGAIFIFLCWAGLHYVVHYYRLLQAEQHKVLEASARSLRAEALAKEAQLKMLRYQLNPHFLFNTLNAVSALVRLGDTEASQETISRLGALLRHSLDADPLEPVPLATELEMLGLYLDIEKTRFGERLQIDLDIDERARRVLVPGFFLQPLAENSIKHAIAASEAGGRLGIRARVSAGSLHVEVTDSGPGMDAAEVGNGRGVGLKNTRERLEALFPGRHRLEFGRPEDPFAVRMSFPCDLRPDRMSAATQVAGT